MPEEQNLAFVEIVGDVPNPERGPMHWTGISSNQAFFDNIRLSSGLCRLDCELNAFKVSAISAAFLTQLNTYFSRVRTAGLKTILHFEYCQGIGQEDATKAIVMAHIAQLTPVLQDNEDILALMWAGFIGPWGEWHNSTNGLENKQDRTDILFALLDALPDTFIALRFPRDKQQIFNDNVITSETAFDGSRLSRTPHYNLCTLESGVQGSDCGTYSAGEYATERNYVASETLYVPHGGETAWDYSADLTCINFPNEISMLRYTYLSPTYHPNCVQKMVDGGCWNTIVESLGYRFVLDVMTTQTAAHPGGTLRVAIDVDNLGYAPPFKQRTAHLVLENQTTSDIWTIEMDVDPRLWVPGGTVSVDEDVIIPSDVSEGDYKLYMWFPDVVAALEDTPEYAITLANTGLWDAVTGYNYLCDLVIDAAWHGYINVLNLALSGANFDSLLSDVGDLGPYSDIEPQPAKHYHSADGPIGTAEIGEAHFNEYQMDEDWWRQKLADLLGGVIGDVTTSTASPSYGGGITTVITFTYAAVDQLEVYYFGTVGSTWQQSGDECRGYIG